VIRLELYKNNYERFPLSFISYLEENTDIWFVTENWNAIFKMSKESYMIEYCGFFEKYIGRAVNGYREMVRWKRKVLAVPITTDCDLCIMEGMEKKYLPFPQIGGGYVVQRTVLIGQYAFIITNDDKYTVLRLDMENNTIDVWISLKECSSSKKISKWMIGDIWQDKDKICCIVRDSNLIVKISVCDKKLECYELEERLSSECRKVEDSIWAVMEDRKGIAQIRGDRVINVIDLNEYVHDYSFYGFVLNDTVLWLFPVNNEDIIKIDLLKKERKLLNYPNTFGWINDARYQRGCRFYCCKEDEKDIILYPRSGNGILLIDKSTDEMKHIPLTVNMREIINKQVNQVGADSILTWENDLKGFINITLERKSSDEKKTGTYSIGENIFNICN